MSKTWSFILVVVLMSLSGVVVCAEDVEIIATGNTAFKSPEYEENCMWVYTSDGVLEFYTENSTGYIGVERDISLDGPPRNTLRVQGYMKTGMYIAPWRKEPWCSDVKTVIIGENILEIGANAFYEMNGIEKVVIKSKEISISSYAFSGCYSLKDVVFCKTKINNLQSCIFENCENLEKIEIPEGTMQLIRTFDGCSKLKEVRLPKSLEKIWLGGESIPNSSEEIMVYYSGSIKEWSEIEVNVDKDVELKLEEISRNVKLNYEEIAVKYNDEYLNMDIPPYIKNDRTMVPMRAIFEALGAEVSWDDETKTAIGVKGDTEIKITIGENVLYKNGEAIELDCAAEITNDRTMVPVRAISEAFGCTVEWNDETKTCQQRKSQAVNEFVPIHDVFLSISW